MSSVPDSLGAVIRGCQTHYSNDSIAELERSLLHREEKKKNWERGGRVEILCYFACFLSFLLLRCGILPLSFSFIP